MGKTFVEDERPCDSCVNVTRYGCVSWNCEYINRGEAIKAWREKHEMADRKTEPTISKMEQVDKDINVRSKDERQWTKENCKGCKYNEYPYDSGTCFVRVCINGNKYEPKDEPQTEDADCDKCIWSVCNYNKAFAFEDEPQADCDGCQHYADKHTADACYECKRSYTDGYEPQTERSE